MVSMSSFKESMYCHVSDNGSAIERINPALENVDKSGKAPFDLQFIEQHEAQTYSSPNSFTKAIHALSYTMGIMRAGTIEMNATLGYL
jgi:hypothetical protein